MYNLVWQSDAAAVGAGEMQPSSSAGLRRAVLKSETG